VRERLYRSRTERVFFGVAGGMADWLGLDPTIVRLVWALLGIFGGSGLLLYVIAVFVIPEEPLSRAMAGEALADAPDPAEPTDPVAAEAWRAERERRRVERERRRAVRPDDGRGALLFGVVLIAVGAWFLMRDYLPAFDQRWFGPGILIVVGVVFLAAALGRRNPGA
jgi:phage shock protein C